MNDPRFKTMFDRLKQMGFEPDGAGNGIHLPGTEQLAKQTNLPGHWSSHEQYTAGVSGQVDALYQDWKRGKVSDTQLALGIKDVQNRNKDSILSGRVRLTPKCRLK